MFIRNRLALKYFASPYIPEVTPREPKQEQHLALLFALAMINGRPTRFL